MMPFTLGAVGSLAVLSIAVGALLLALGDGKRGKRAVVFGVTLGIVGEALVRNGEALARNGAALWESARTHRTEIGWALLGTVTLLALLRMAWSARGGSGEPKLSKKRRVQGGP